MSQVIAEEVRFLLVSVVWGGLMSAGYELLRLGRLLFRHGQWWIGLEDLLYWTICAVLVFWMVMEENDGMIRWYALAGCVVGAGIYQRLFHRLFVWALRPLWKGYTFFRQFVENLLKKRKKSVTLRDKT